MLRPRVRASPGRLVLASVSCGALLAPAATSASAASTPLRPTVMQFPALGGPYADGRYVILPPSAPGAGTRVRDDDTGLVKDTGCSGLKSIAGGSALGNCPAGATTLSVWSFSTGTSRTLAATDGEVGGFMGRQWFPLIVASEAGSSVASYFNWHTGQRRRAPNTGADLDSAALVGGKALAKGDLVAGVDSPTQLNVTPERGVVRLRTGSSVRKIKACRRTSGCGNFSFSRGVLTWLADGQPHAYRVSTARTFTVALPDGFKHLGYVTHTSRRIYFTVDGRAPTPGSFDLGPRQTYALEARIPAGRR